MQDKPNGSVIGVLVDVRAIEEAGDVILITAEGDAVAELKPGRQRLERRAIRPFAGHFQRDVMPAPQQFLHH